MLRYFILFLTLIQIAFSDKSFTIVTDTTASMREEIQILKNNIQTVVDAARNRNFANYILLPFGDNDVGPPLVTSNPEYLLDLIHLVEVAGGRDCPEDSLAAIEKALQISKPKSYIYVFTDAQAKSQSRLEAIQNLCQTKGSQVIIFQSGKCVPQGIAHSENENVYYEVANKCGGSVFHFHLGNLYYAFKYMKEITSIEWSDVDSHIEFSGRKRFTFIMDVYTKDFIVAVSGNYPKITITNSFGDSPQIEKIVDTHAFLVIRVKNAGIGELTTDVTCQGTAVTTFYRRKEISFQVGFSPFKPKSLRETSSRPLPDVATFMIISLPEQTTELLTLELQMTDNNMETKMLQYHSLDERGNLYIAEVFVASYRAFKVFIRCRDEITGQEISGYSNVLESQRTVNGKSGLRNSAPLIELLEPESVLVDYGTNYTGVCKANSNEKPLIWWENDAGETLSSESALLQHPSTYISYVRIENVNKNDTITCKCKNDQGEDAVALNLYVNRTFTFEIVQKPTDATIEFGMEGKLFCEANAYPEAVIKWYHNDTLLEESENVELVNDEYMLLIKNMGIDDTGEYKCEVSNSVTSESYVANVYITGLEPPQIKLNTAEIQLKPGDFTEENCVVLAGIPVPEVTWKYKSEDGSLDFDPVPDGVVVEGKSLKIPAADITHGGFYVCEAVNLLGTDSQHVKVKVQYAPKIKNGDEIITVKEGEMVELPCDVDAVPKANVHWDMYQDDVIIAFDNHHHCDDRHTHRFSARYNDSGMYHCIAENEMGTAIRTVRLNVLVPPYIEHLPWETLSVRAGTTLILSCDVTFGNPVPSTKWEYISPKFDTTVLQRSHSMGKLDLILGNVTRRQEGIYQCVAENEVGPDTIKVHLKVL
ncbi:hemicentin-1-like [Maniola hyperantus]|uniref:hemicentin-1-like n=1 Tax=Aphantopus hyperantus TaxID=2795564 RepID=UPI001569682A|nr:hemicentin-1-like [Maniola hyperantus]